MSDLPNIIVLEDSTELAKTLAINFLQYIRELSNKNDQINIALSGGNTPLLFFAALRDLNPQLDWSKIHLFWVDDRCVPPDHPESNYGVANKEIIEPLKIPIASVHRIMGEYDPESEAVRYAKLIKKIVTPFFPFPRFDLTFLGMGTDGHTASIFPDQLKLWNEQQLCTVGTHPKTGQKRVSFTGRLINSTSKVVIMLVGKEKSDIARKVITKAENYLDYPVSYVNPAYGETDWYLDKEAASLLHI